MMLSSAVWFLLLERLGSSLNYYMILTEIPSYLKDMFGINIVKVRIIRNTQCEGPSPPITPAGKMDFVVPIIFAVRDRMVCSTEA